MINNRIHGCHPLNCSSGFPSSCRHHFTDYSPVFSPVLTDTSAFSSVRGPWGSHRLDTIVKATRVHDVHWQGEAWERQGRGDHGGVSEVLKGTVPLPQPMITHLPVPVVGLRAGVGVAVWVLSGALKGKV